MPLPDLLVHADWGSAPKKRWMAVADVENGRVTAHAPEPVGDLGTLLHRLDARAPGPRVALGVDFPIGLPAAYAEAAGIDHFPTALLRFGSRDWTEFYDLAAAPDEIGLRRPFYPRRPGGTRQHHLTDALGGASMADLLRRCDRATADRGAASPLFWTLGPKQAGRAAILGWRDVLAPGIRKKQLRLWPFDGGFLELAADPGVVVAETYPAEACVHLGVGPPGRGWAKTSQAGRRSVAPAFFDWAARRGVALAPALRALVADGFGDRKDGEDPFDAVLGLVSLVEVATGHRPDGAPDTPDVRRVEGWILGMRPGG